MPSARSPTSSPSSSSQRDAEVRRPLKPRKVRAPNGGSFTLDGTRTFLVGHRKVAVIDPGPDVESHIRALFCALKKAETTFLLLTHGHSDHAGGAGRLAGLLEAPIMAPRGFSASDHPSVVVKTIREGDSIETDQGCLHVLETPGHSRDHLTFHWREAEALFVGDLLLGRGNTTWVGEYLGCVDDYLASLDKIEALNAATLYPTHGPPITSPARSIGKYRRHRLQRLEEVRFIREAKPAADAIEIAEVIYGEEIPSKLLKAAREGVEAALFHLDKTAGSS